MNHIIIIFLWLGMWTTWDWVILALATTILIVGTVGILNNEANYSDAHPEYAKAHQNDRLRPNNMRKIKWLASIFGGIILIQVISGLIIGTTGSSDNQHGEQISQDAQMVQNSNQMAQFLTQQVNNTPQNTWVNDQYQLLLHHEYHIIYHRQQNLQRDNQFDNSNE